MSGTEGEVEVEIERLTLEVSADDTDAEAMAQTSRALLAHPLLRYEFPGGDLWLVRFDVSEKDTEPRHFSALVQDTVSGRLLLAHGLLGAPSSVTLSPMSDQRAPGDEEFAWAVTALAEDEEFGRLLGEDGASTYRPMPPLANATNPDGTIDRVVTVGIRSEAGESRHRVVGVRTADGVVVPEPLGAPLGWKDECGLPAGPECPSTSGPPRAHVRVTRGDLVLWDLVVVRPSSSSGTNGSGVELRSVDYKGQRVLARAHLPIVNIGYDEAVAGCGPTHRSWQHDEGCFRAEGSEPVPGFRVCSGPPSTVLESGDAGGDFRGVALWLDGDELLIVSQLQAGWYRYVNEWRLLADGTIRPRFASEATRNPCGCAPQVHHAYWRFDFDILGAANNLVQEHNEPPVLGTSSWHTTRYEVRRPRDPDSNRFWRIRNIRSSQGYSLIPGAEDGDADDYGAGDVWILGYHESEIDDGHGITSDPGVSRAHLDRFVSGEPVEREDVVLWYAGHHRRGPDERGRRIGPDLVPSNWRDLPVGTETFAPPEPPARPS